MKQVYEKYELSFSLICIAGYVVIFNIADMISHALGIEKVVTAPICVAGLIILFVWMKK